ncbi:MAG: radical SAM protein [Candidatus Hydrothermota bacterium]|nr:MAG: radical SAM protein [Candidatus Hydrothermae bacterium]
MKVLLVNPPIYDFAAHDFWMKPYGLLNVAGMLKAHGVKVFFFDFMDRNFPKIPKFKSDRFGRGKFYYEVVEKPEPLRFVPRRFKRYGIPLKFFEDFLKSIEPPDAVLISTGMTYWYLGVIEVAQTVRKAFSDVKIGLGGIYSTLLPHHAQKVINPDFIADTSIEQARLFEFLGIDRKEIEFLPAWELYPKLEYGVIKLTDGCPYRCTYCASWKFAPHFTVRSIAHALRELEKLSRLGIKDIAFYDDALLLRPQDGILRFLEHIEPNKFRFHTPNALHARFITPEIAKAMKDKGFETIYLGYESVNPERQRLTGGKVTSDEFWNAVENLLVAGFRKTQITAYLLMGLPDQPLDEVEQGIREVTSAGIKVMLSEFSPIPGTPDGEKARRWIDLDEPLLQNNIVFPIVRYGYDEVSRIKALKNKLNQGIAKT